MEKYSWKTYFARNMGVEWMRDKPQHRNPVRLMIVDEARAVGRTILDVGCATCIDYPLCRAAGLEYTGIDITKKFVESARKRYPGVDARVGDALALPFPDGSFDAVYSKDTITYFPPPLWRKGVDEVWRVARRLVLFSFCSPLVEKTRYQKVKVQQGAPVWDNRYGRGEFTDYVKGHVGFERMEIRSMRVWKPDTPHELYLFFKKSR